MMQVLQAAWLHDPLIVAIMRALGAPDVDVRFVGGCVRDELAGLPVSDIDVATPDTPDVVTRKLEAAGIRAIPTGLSHGTVTAQHHSRTIEVTTLRRDTACDGRHAVVEFTTDWAEDARRRDFTINAMSLRLTGELIDLAGGRDDLAVGRVRFVGDASDRIKEDYLRILRFFRFHARFGRGPIDPSILSACAAHKDGLRGLSAERVTQELVKLLRAPNPFASVQAMHSCGVLSVVLPEVTHLHALSDLLVLEEKLSLGADWRRRLAILLPITDARALAQRLRLSNADADFLQALVAAQPQLDTAMPAAALDLALYRHGREIILNRCLVAASHAPSALWQPIITRAAAWTPKPMPLTGDDLIAAGMTPGPEIGRALQRAEEHWVNSNFSATTNALQLGALRRR